MSDPNYIFSYTTEDGINDGIFVRLDSIPELAVLPQQAGIQIPVIVTTGVYEDMLKPNDPDGPADIVGRTWDVLWMFTMAARGKRTDSMIEFFVINGTGTHKLWAFVEPLSDGSPIIKIMKPEEY